MKHFALLALLALLFAPAAYAQTPAGNMDARVAILKGQIEGFLDNQKAMALKNGCRLDTKGELTVEKASGYYAFTLPHITYTDSKGIHSEIGMLAVNAVPQGDDEWKITLALPTPIVSYNAQGGKQFQTDIGTQSASGVWNEKLGHFTSVNSSFNDVRFNNLIDQSTVTVGAIGFASSLTENDPEAYTGSARATFDNISMFDAATSFKSTLPKIVMDTNLADRASKTPMTKEQVKSRPQSTYPDFYNVFSFLFGAPERVTAKVTGLDTINSQLQQAMITASPDARQKILQSIIGVTAASGMGKPVTGDVSTKSYDVVFGQNGSVTINGTDFGSLVKSAPPAATAGTPVLH